MNEKQAALENVHVQAQSYADLQQELELQRKRLADAIVKASKKDLTQQKIADACVVGDFKLSRQRIAQIVQENT